ncbi:GNAT family N-acetyltransferase [Dongia rigui]|uniref:N-acetyltransferase n=1 Tax=Dongia rigui TaxID=940149 RepID=A0ABU5DXP4_9PROT|nr:N-acetyltransferase [Dongia rigui]MDY0871978.1 N-acetyltransferase [Dongia rigui]
MSVDAVLNWRVERLCHHAWPSLDEERHGDWVFRFSNGLSRRGNSANPLGPEADDVSAMLQAADAAYPRHGLPVLVRVPALLDASVERDLSARGFASEGETLTLYCDLPPGHMRRDPDVLIAPAPTEDWLQRIWALKDLSAKDRATYRAIVAALDVPSAFMALNIGGALVAMGFVAIDDRLLCIESLITDPAHRGQGHAKRLVGAMLAFGITQGVEGACLQVVADNEPAIRLYRGMGFSRELYRYRYWRSAP